MAYLTREAILEAEDLGTEEVDVPEWGGTVLVRGLSADERDKLESAVMKNGKPNLDGFSARLAAASLVDADGNQLFSQSQADLKRLGQQPAAALNRIRESVQRLSKINEVDVEDLAGNSEPGH